MLKLDDYLQQKTGTLHVSEGAFELGDFTALGKFDDLATARRAVDNMQRTSSDTQVTMAQAAMENVSGAASEDAAGFVGRRSLNGALIGAAIATGVALVAVLFVRPFDARYLLGVLVAAQVGAIIGGLFNVYVRLGDDSEIHEAPEPTAGQFYVALRARDQIHAQGLANLMGASGAASVEVLDRSDQPDER